MDHDDWLTIGKVGRPHGLDGSFYVSSRQEPIPEEISEVTIGTPQEGGLTVKILKQRYLKNKRRVLLTCDGIGSREAVIPQIGKEIWATRKQFCFDPSTEYFWADLIAKEIFDIDQKPVGSIRAVSNYGASDIVTVSREDGKSAQIPFVRAYFCMDFKPSDGKIFLTVTRDTLDDTWE